MKTDKEKKFDEILNDIKLYEILNMNNDKEKTVDETLADIKFYEEKIEILKNMQEQLILDCNFSFIKDLSDSPIFLKRYTNQN